MTHVPLDARQSRRLGLSLIAGAFLVVVVFGLTSVSVFFALVLVLPGLMFALPDRIMARLSAMSGRPTRGYDDETEFEQQQRFPSRGSPERYRSRDIGAGSSASVAVSSFDSFGNSSSRDTSPSESSSSGSSDSGSGSSSSSTD